MVGKRARIVAASVVVAALAIGAGTAYSASRTSSSESFLNDFAGHLGVSPSKVQAAWLATIKDRLDQAVKDGHLTRSQEAAILAHIKDHQPFAMPGPFGGFPPGQMRQDGHHGPPPWAGPGSGGGPWHGPFLLPPGGPLDAAATYLGVSVTDLFTELRSGKTLAQIATSKGRSVSGLEAAMVKAQTTQLDKAVSQGHLTKSQASAIETGLKQRVDEVVHHGFNGGHDDHGQWSGPVPWSSSSSSGSSSNSSLSYS
jgi:hypothetical protein